MALRVGTFNARFLPHLPSNARRAELLADRIQDGAYDLIVLTEVFSGRARRVLVQGLAHSYPWNVQYIGSRRIVREDSGLMVLSRLPFEALPASPELGHPRIRASATGATRDWQDVWFVEYGDCTASDCLAGKGAGYVRVRYGGRPLHVFFTHMQAAYDYHGPRRQARTRQVRSAQLQQLAGLVRAALGSERAGSDNTLILGDLNVDGVRGGTGTGAVPAIDGTEWSEMLSRLGGPFRRGLTDVWDRYAPVDDPGHTFPAWHPHARRDYVLLSPSDSDVPLTVHHVSLDRDLARPDDGAEYVSDHLGIRVDLNGHQAGCHPLDAHVLGELNGGVTIEGHILHPGGLQWYAVTAPGVTTVELGLRTTNPSAMLEVYGATDISRPLAPFVGPRPSTNGTTSRYRLRGDSFIRIGRPGSTSSGTYHLDVTPVA